MFGIYGVNGPVFRGRLEELPAVRAVSRRRPVEAIGTAGNELGDIDANPLPTTERNAVEAYRRVVRIDQERGPLLHARQLMQAEVITVRSDADVVRAWRVLTRERIHQAPVLDASRALVGIVSERDLLTALNLDGDDVRDALARRVADVMTSPVVAADALTDIRRIAQAMIEYGVDGIPIVNEHQRLVGFISRGDVLRAVVNEPQLSLWR
jgi:acetoin utilization protein AcuB